VAICEIINPYFPVLHFHVGKTETVNVGQTFIRDSKGLVTHAEIEDPSEFRGQRIRATKVK